MIMLKQFKKVVLCIVCSLLLPGAFFSHAADAPAADDPTLEFQKFFHALKLIRMHYVDGEKVSYEKLFNMALQGLMKELDPYCVYESAETFKQTRTENSGERVGIGIFMVLQHGKLTVRATDPGSPAEKAGLKPGDLILEVDGTPTDSKDMNVNAGLIQGPVGERVTLKIYRPSSDQHLDLIVERKMMHIRSVTGEKILDKANGTGYVRITQFNQSTAADLDTALAKLKEHNLQTLIIDLRGNPGGLVSAATQVCSRFLPPEKTIVSLIGRNEKVLKSFTSEKCSASWQELPLVLLVDGATASAAEIVTACLQDYKRAIVIGEQTFGKGVVQNLIPFGKNEALRLTTAHYYTPAKRAIQEKGITPDIILALSPARRYALANQLNIHPGVIMPLTKNAVRDVQLERATEVLKAVKLFRDAHKESK